MKQTLLGPMWLIHGDVVSDTLAEGKHWDPHVYDALEPYLGKTVIDVGANVGGLTLRFSEKAEHVIAFEPHPVLNACLVENTKGRRVTVRGGLYSRAVRLECQPKPGHSPSSWAWVPADEGLYNAYPCWTTRTVSAIKVDAQGADLHCLLGLESVICRDYPAIVFEFENDLSILHRHPWESYESFLTHWGYTVTQVKEGHSDFLAVKR